IDCDDVVPRLEIDMAERRGGTGDAGIADEDIDLAMALMQGRAKPCEAVAVGHAQRHQRRRAAVLPDLIVELFKPALCARDRDDVRAGLRQCARSGIADAARGAGDDSNARGEIRGHQLFHVCAAAYWQTWMAGTSPTATKIQMRGRLQ